MRRIEIKKLHSERMLGNKIGLGNRNAKSLRGRKQFAEHIAKRVASLKLSKAIKSEL